MGLHAGTVTLASSYRMHVERKNYVQVLPHVCQFGLIHISQGANIFFNLEVVLSLFFFVATIVIKYSFENALPMT